MEVLVEVRARDARLYEIWGRSSIDGSFYGGGDDFYGGMFDGGIERSKSGFFSSIDDAVFERWVVFDRFDRFHGDECRVFSGVGGGDLVEEGFDVFGGFGEVLRVDDFVACDRVTCNVSRSHFVACCDRVFVTHYFIACNSIAMPGLSFFGCHCLFLFNDYFSANR